VHALLIIIKAGTVTKNPAGAKKTASVRPVEKTKKTASVRPVEKTKKMVSVSPVAKTKKMVSVSPVAKTKKMVSVSPVAKTKKMVSVRNAPAIINTTTNTATVPRKERNVLPADNY
jgi:hypothetical protein